MQFNERKKNKYMKITYKELKTIRDSLDENKDDKLLKKINDIIESQTGALDDEFVLTII
jgi:hypothetical protein